MDNMLRDNIKLISTEVSVDLAQSIENFTESEINSLCVDFYGENAKASCYTQVNLFLNHPQHLSICLQSLDSNGYVHQKIINNLNKAARKLNWQQNSKPQRGTLIILGVGIGYHIMHLLERVNYSDVIIVEPNVEQLALASHHICLSSIKNICEKRHGKLRIFTCKTYEDFVREFINLVNNHEPSLVADVSLFRHYSSPEFDKVFTNFKVWRNSAASLWGFYEDELMSLTHTIENSHHNKISSHSNVFEKYKSTPIIIAGNGPSLDDDISHLQSVKNNVLIVSCGTSLNALLENGITPDIHVEMERSPESLYIKREQVRQLVNKESIFIGLNTVFPEYIQLFENRIIFAKANDLGASLLKEEFTNLQLLYNCNPTVTNMALSSLLRLGFKNIFLLGCDYGYTDPKYHHSKHSAYFDEDSNLSNSVFLAEISVKGNFEETVSTSRIFNESRLVQQKNIIGDASLTVTNCSNGAKIEGTKVEHFKNLKFPNIHKEKVINDIKLYSQFRSNKAIKSDNTLNTASYLVAALMTKLREEKSIEGIVKLISSLVKDISSSSDFKKVNYLLSGTLKYILLAISSHINHIPIYNRGDYLVELKFYLDKYLLFLTEK